MTSSRIASDGRPSDPALDLEQAPARGGNGHAPARPRPSFSRASAEVEMRIHLARVGDTAVVLVALLGEFIVTNLGHMPSGLREFLAVRLTVKNLVLLVGFVLMWRGFAWLTGLYQWQQIKRKRAEFGRVILTCTLVSAVALVFPLISVSGAFRYTTILLFWLTVTGLMLLTRSLLRAVFSVPEANIQRDAIIVGTGPRALSLEAELRDTRPGEYNIVGFMDPDGCPAGDFPGPFLGTLDEMEGVLMRRAIDEVFVALPIKSRYAEIQRAIESCERVGVRARYLADLFESSRVWVGHVEGERVSLVAAPNAPKGWRMAAKRATDVLGAIFVLVLVAPVLLVAALFIKLSSPGPVLFTQDRYGKNRRLFRMYKLRTMVVDAEARQSDLEELNEASGPVFKIRADPRVTPVGHFLRRFSIDELPQLLNVLRGEMSLVGPRPLPVRDVHRFTEATLMRRFSVRPGLTCLWQINGRNEVGFEEWIRLDLQYIDNWSLLLDAKILLRTLPAVFKATGAS